MNAIKNEIMSKYPLMTDEEYWEEILSISNNALADIMILNQLFSYYQKRNDDELGEEAEEFLLRWFKVWQRK